ncbi:MAG: hypothetical protein M3Q97_05815 [Bacteroidota bacterium]|nr:hypothetical protein [Bacteroidota bacterium]
MILFAGCRKQVVEEVVYDNVIYDLDTVAVYGSATEKTRQKSAAQYYSILYGDLFQKSIPSDEMNDLSIINSAVGDKKMLNDLIVTSYLSVPEVKVPTATEMRAGIDKFIRDTYLRFYLREPSETEKYHFRSLITEDAAITPKMIYSAFALSNEYFFY